MRTITDNSKSYRWIVVAVTLLTVVIGVSASLVHEVFASDAESAQSGRKLVTIHDRGKEVGMLTKAATIGQALREAGIAVAKKDLVEPSLDEPLVAKSYDVNIYRARPVVIVDGNTTQRVLSPYQTSKQITQDAGIVLQDEDITSAEPIADIAAYGAGIQVTIDRATPFTLVLYGKKTQAYSQAVTVGGMLKEKNITLGKSDSMSIKAGTPLKAGMMVQIWRDGKQTITVEEAINFPIEKIQDADHEVGYREVKTPGIKGRKIVTYEVVMKSGKTVKRTKIQSVTTKQPKKQVEIVGAKLSFSGDFGAALSKLRTCESGGDYANKHNPLYRGAYQFGYQTWANYGGYYDPADAPAPIQDQAARLLYERRGWQPWPVCGANLPDTYR